MPQPRRSELRLANRGAREARGRSIGCNIELPVEQTPNPYLDRWITFRHFIVREVMLVKYSYALVALIFDLRSRLPRRRWQLNE